MKSFIIAISVIYLFFLLLMFLVKYVQKLQKSSESETTLSSDIQPKEEDKAMVLKKGLSVKHEDIGPYKEPKEHVKPAKERKYSDKANKKIHKVIKEFEEGKLHSGSKTGPKVTNLKQGVAIALSEARRKGYKVPKKKK